MVVDAVRKIIKLFFPACREKHLRRPNQLMAEVEVKRTTFTSLVLYDVSRWGRFQDADESVSYEYLLVRAATRVHYCAEQFENDGTISSSVLKTLKRSMAAEYIVPNSRSGCCPGQGANCARQKSPSPEGEGDEAPQSDSGLRTEYRQELGSGCLP